MSKEYTLIGGNGTVVSPLEVTEDGDYVAGDSRAFNPVKVRTGGGGSSTLSGLTDVDISNPSDGQTLVYNATSGKWVNGSGGGGGALIVHNIDGTLDKTWQEIHDAGAAFVLTQEDEDELLVSWITPVAQIVRATNGSMFGIENFDNTAYTTDNANGYPVKTVIPPPG